MNDTKMVDMMVAALSDPFDDCHMGVTAENVAKKYEISRQDQDALAVESHRRAGSAIDQGFFKGQIVPIEVKVKRDKVPFVTDETVWHGTTVEKLGKLPTVFDPEGSVTRATHPASTMRRRLLCWRMASMPKSRWAASQHVLDTAEVVRHA